MTTFTLVSTDWGHFAFVVREGKLAATYLPASRSAALDAVKRQWGPLDEAPAALPQFQKQVRAYFAGQAVEFDVDLDLAGATPFQRRVVEHCRRIAPGRTKSYGELARAAGRPGAARAVGSVMSHNRVPIVVPCHRVVRADGSLGGFSSPGGLRDKERLLALESRSAAPRSNR